MCIGVNDFLTDDDFIEYILNETPQLKAYWENYFRAHSEQLALADEAKGILLAPSDVSSGISVEEALDLKNRIISGIKDCLDI